MADAILIGRLFQARAPQSASREAWQYKLDYPQLKTGGVLVETAGKICSRRMRTSCGLCAPAQIAACTMKTPTFQIDCISITSFSQDTSQPLLKYSSRQFF